MLISIIGSLSFAEYNVFQMTDQGTTFLNRVTCGNFTSLSIKRIGKLIKPCLINVMIMFSMCVSLAHGEH